MSNEINFGVARMLLENRRSQPAETEKESVETEEPSAVEPESALQQEVAEDEKTNDFYIYHHHTQTAGFSLGMVDWTLVAILAIDGGVNIRNKTVESNGESKKSRTADGVFNINLGGLISVGGVVKGGLAAGFRYSLLTHPADKVARQLLGAKISPVLTSNPGFVGLTAEVGALLQVDQETERFHPGIEGSFNVAFPYSAVGVFAGTHDVRPDESAGVFMGLRISVWGGKSALGGVL